MFVRTHIASGTLTASVLAFQPFKKVHWKGEWNGIIRDIYHMPHLLNCHCPMDLVISYLNHCNIFTPSFSASKLFPVQSILCVVLKTHL